VLYSDRLRPYSQTLELAGKACHGQTLSLSTNIQITYVKKFNNIKAWQVRGEARDKGKVERVSF
jgi:hypothetical protein